MGAYMSQPNTEKSSEDGEGPGGIRYGVSDMQGWRMHMEDAHITKPELNKGSGVGMFAVFDGHGGQEVAKFVAKYMPSEFQKIAAEKKGDFVKSLPEAFHRMDVMLRDDKHSSEIRSLSRDASAAASPGAAGAAGAGGGAGGSAAVVRSSIDSSLEEARKKGKLSQKEAMEIMLKMMALQRMEKGGAAGGAGKGAAGVNGESAGDEVTAAGCTANVVLLTSTHVMCANAGENSQNSVTALRTSTP